MKLSIITSLYKSDKYLPLFIERVKDFNKKIKDKDVKIEHIIIQNDPSNVEKEILRKNKDVFTKTISVERETIYSSWNRGINESSGDVITFWNVDDKRNADAIIDGIKKLKEDNIDLVYFPFIYKRYIKIFNIPILIKIKKIDPPEFDKKQFYDSMHCGPFFMFKRNFLKQVGNFDDSFKIAGDFDWCIRASKIGKFKKSNKVAGTFYNYGDSLSGSKNSRHKKENEIIYNKYNIIK